MMLYKPLMIAALTQFLGLSLFLLTPDAVAEEGLGESDVNQFEYQTDQEDMVGKANETDSKKEDFLALLLYLESTLTDLMMGGSQAHANAREAIQHSAHVRSQLLHGSTQFLLLNPNPITGMTDANAKTAKEGFSSEKDSGISAKGRHPRERKLSVNLKQRLQKCQAGRRKCNRDVIGLRRERNKARRDLDSCHSNHDKCMASTAALEDRVEVTTDKFRRCRGREEQCEYNLKQCRLNTRLPTARPSSTPSEYLSWNPSAAPSTAPTSSPEPSPPPSSSPSNGPSAPSSGPTSSPEPSSSPTESLTPSESPYSSTEPSASPISSNLPSSSSVPSISPTMSPPAKQDPDEFNPCSSYGSVVNITSSAGFCDALLQSDTAYVLANNVSCPGGGASLTDKSCLDCRGHSIRGSKSDNRNYGVTIPDYISGAFVHNCIFQDFYNGLQIEGNENVISNVKVTKSGGNGILNLYGTNNEIRCSVSEDNEWIGIASVRGSINITGSLAKNNAQEGVFLRSDADVACSEIRSNGREGIEIRDNHVRRIQDSIVYDNRYHGIRFATADGETSLADVVACGSVDDRVEDIYISRESTESIETENLTCDEVDNNSRSVFTPVCDMSCSSHVSSAELPASCSEVCPLGRGPYDPSE